MRFREHPGIDPRRRWLTVGGEAATTLRFLIALIPVLAAGTDPAQATPERVSGRGDGVTYDLHAAYPNIRRAHRSFLAGVNEVESPTSTAPGPHGTSLWFQPLSGGAFRQFNTTPYRVCHWDLLRWGTGRDAALVYLETHAGCYSLHAEITFEPGIAYMPRTWTTGHGWTRRGTSVTTYSEDGVVVCAGTNEWRSRVVDVVVMRSGDRAIHTQTNETQVLAPVAGAPASSACPIGASTSFAWQENFYLGIGLPVQGTNRQVVGSDGGLERSTGGNVQVYRQSGQMQWDVVFTRWVPLPPTDAGTLATSTETVPGATTGHTITFVYTAPSLGTREASLTLEIPDGWSRPTTADAPGCTTASAGTVTTRGQLITVSGLTLPPRGQVVISYGATDGEPCTASDGATAPSVTGAPVWQAAVALTPNGRQTDIASSPSIYVTSTCSC